MESILLEREGAVSWLTLNRPEKRNALSLEMMTALLEKLEEAAADSESRVLVIRANGPVFSSGHDLRELAGEEQDLHAYRRIFAACTTMMLRMHQLPQPVIAQVHGVATAAGCQLVAACDLAVADAETRFATPGVRIGLFCSTPMVPLVRLIGRRRALEMLMTGRFVSAEEAERFGLVNRVVPRERLAEETRALAQQLAESSRFTMSFGKQAFYAQVDLDELSAYRYAGEAMALNCLAQDAREGIRAFLEKRPPQWQDR